MNFCAALLIANIFILIGSRSTEFKVRAVYNVQRVMFKAFLEAQCFEHRPIGVAKSKVRFLHRTLILVIVFNFLLDCFIFKCFKVYAFLLLTILEPLHRDFHIAPLFLPECCILDACPRIADLLCHYSCF